MKILMSLIATLFPASCAGNPKSRSRDGKTVVAPKRYVEDVYEPPTVVTRYIHPGRVVYNDVRLAREYTEAPAIERSPCPPRVPVRWFVQRERCEQPIQRFDPCPQGQHVQWRNTSPQPQQFDHCHQDQPQFPHFTYRLLEQ